jgi:S-adenosylmethionine decarboxylase
MIYEGKHLFVDAICENVSALNDKNVGIKAIDNIIIDIDMTAIMPTTAINFPHAISEANRILEALEKEGLGSCITANRIKNDLHNRKMQTYGYTCWSIIAESHITLHTFPEEKFFSFDCYSCKDFDHNLIMSILADHFLIIKDETQIIERRIPQL